MGIVQRVARGVLRKLDLGLLDGSSVLPLLETMGVNSGDVGIPIRGNAGAV